MSRSALIVLVAAGLWILPGVAASQELGRCPAQVLSATVPAGAPDSVPTEPPSWQHVYGPEISLGVGHVRVVDGFSWTWPQEITLPLFAASGGSDVGWIANGWAVPAEGGEAEPLSGGRTIETGYETQSLVVEAVGEDGWLLLSIEEPGLPDQAWTHECAFRQGALTLGFERWEDRLTSGEISPLFFRMPGRQELRSGPGADAEIAGWVPLDENAAYHMEPLEVRGDWMRVLLVEPSNYCAGDDLTVTRTEGWVRWRDEAVGPRVWYHTRGC